MCRVIVLCAGVGERLRPLTYTTNKSLLEIYGKTLIEHFLEALISSEADVEAVDIVIGHYGYKFRKLLGDNYKGLRIHFLENKLFNITGAAQSLYLASDILSSNPCIVLEGDHYLDPDLLKELVDSDFENCLLIDEDKKRLKFDEEVVAYGLKDNVEFLKWMPPYPLNPIGEALTIFKICKKTCASLVPILESYLLEHGTAKREIIEPFNRLMRCHDFHYIPTKGRKWVEVDFPEDLEYARLIN